MLVLKCVLGMCILGMFIGCYGNTFSPINGTWRGTDQIGTPATLYIDTNNCLAFHYEMHCYTGTINRIDNRFRVYVKRNDGNPVDLWERYGFLINGKILNESIIVRIPCPDYSIKFRFFKNYEPNGGHKSRNLTLDN